MQVNRFTPSHSVSSQAKPQFGSIYDINPAVGRLIGVAIAGGQLVLPSVFQSVSHMLTPQHGGNPSGAAIERSVPMPSDRFTPKSN
jgi:hypothetical protein